MADNEQFDDDISIDDLLEDYAPEIAESEKKYDELIGKIAKQQKEISERQRRLEMEAERAKIVGEFMKSASDEERELAEVLIAGVEDPVKVKALLELAKKKASSPVATSDGQEAEEQEKESEDVSRAFTPPVESAPPEVKDVTAELAKRTRAGDSRAAALEALMSWGSPTDLKIAEGLKQSRR